MSLKLCKLIVLFSLINLIFSNCATIPKQTDKDIPLSLQSYFSHCHSRQGYHRFKALSDQQTVFEQEMVWKTGSNKSLQLDFISPLGQSLQKLLFTSPDTITRGGGQTSGQAAGQTFDEHSDRFSAFVSPDFLTLESDNLLIQKHKIGLKYYELGCLMSGAFPRDWVQRVFRIQKIGSIASLDSDVHSETDSRNFSFTFENHQACVAISWKEYLVFSRDARICLRSDIHQMTYEASNFKLILENLDEYL